MNTKIGEPTVQIGSMPKEMTKSGYLNFVSITAKRSFDIFGSTLGLILISPVFLIIGLLIRRDSPGPIFYRGPRVGKDGKVFGILKFRTMHEDPESYAGPRVTAQDDPRITPLGRWLRDTKLNELPQLWNVLMGEMSFVGPRPEDPEIAAGWDPTVRSEVLSVRPGITSPASVLYRDEETLLKTDEVMSTYLDSILPSKLRLDQLYVRHRSFWLDLDILFWTFLVLLPKLGNYSLPEENLFLGPVSRLIRRYVSWFTIDTVITFFAIAVTGLFWRTFGPLDVGLPKAIAIALGFALIFSLAGAFFRVNRISWSNTGALDAIDLLPAVIVATIIAFIIDLLWKPSPLLPPPLILLASGVAYIGFVMVRYRSRLVHGLIWRWLSARGGAFEAKERVLIIGGGEAGQFMSWLLHSSRASGVFRAVGIVDDDLYKLGTRIQGLEVLGRRSDIPQLVAKHDIGIIVFAIHNIPQSERKQLLEICVGTPARVVVMPDILGIMNSIRLESEDREKGAAVPSGEVLNDYQNFPITYRFPSQVYTWLTELEASIESGDLDKANAKIQAYKHQIQFENPQRNKSYQDSNITLGVQEEGTTEQAAE